MDIEKIEPLFSIKVSAVNSEDDAGNYMIEFLFNITNEVTKKKFHIDRSLFSNDSKKQNTLFKKTFKAKVMSYIDGFII